MRWSLRKQPHHQTLTAFATGTVLPITAVNDPVFSARTMGDGVAIEPEESTIVAPVDGTVAVLLPDSAHAVGLRLADGAELLLHIGLDTVQLQGRGFKGLVDVGDSVRVGDPLLEFDPAVLGQAGYSPITMLVVLNPAGRSYDFVADTRVEQGITTICTVSK